LNIRALAAKCCYSVIDKGRSLSDELPRQQTKLEAKDKGLLQEICYGVLRFLPELEHEVRQLMQKPLTGKQRVFHFLMLVGIYQLRYMRIPDHAAVSETVAATGALKNRQMKSLINGVLRNYQRAMEKSSGESASTHETLADAIKYNHPGWFIKKLQAAYPDNWQTILQANQQKPPMWLRVNSQHNTSEHYQALLKSADIEFSVVEPLSKAIALSRPIDVNKLPGFEQGFVSIQDAAAQQAAQLLDCKAGDNVLDCCAAPGGKTCHILERTPDIAAMTAIDIEEGRLVRVKENLARLNLTATVIAGDAAAPEKWWDKQLFDRILLDAPCSGTGVIRRHPDIKWLRKASDIETLTQLQQQILQNIWPLLKPGGTLIYATCSVLPEENSEQIKCFIENTPNVQHVPIKEQGIGWQILPKQTSENESSMDGFYYAKLIKTLA